MEVENKIQLLCYFNEIDSTNDFLQKILAESKGETIKPTLVFSKIQHKGKGRGGKFFYSPKGGVYFSCLLPNFIPNPDLPLKVGLFISKKIKEKFKTPVLIRWPNDLIINNMKYGGILIETNGNYVIIGIGLNIERSVSSKIKDQRTTYLNKHLKKNLKVKEFIKIVEKWVLSSLLDFIKKPLDLNLWEKFSYFKKGEKIIWEEKGEKKEGIYEGISIDGSLIAIQEEKKVNLYSVEKIYKK